MRHFEFNLFNLVKVARCKKLNSIPYSKLEFSHYRTGNQVVFRGFFKGDNRVPPCTKVGFTSFPSGRFSRVAIVNLPDEKLVNFTSVHCKTWAELTPIDSKTKDTS